MAYSQNLKVNMTADTSQFSAGLKNAKKELKDFEKVSDDALGAVGNAIGVDTGKLDQMASAARGLGAKMQESGNQSVQALGSILSKVNAVSAGIAGLGIAAATAAFKLLNQEATWFKSTIEGANIDMATAAYVKAYSDTLHGLNSATGKAVAEAGSNIKKALGVVGTTFKNAILGTMTGGEANFGTAVLGMGPAIKEGLQNAEKAEDISNQIFAINKKILEQSTQMAATDARIAELRRQSTDPLESAATRLAAINEATALIKSKYEGPEGLIALNTQLSDLQQQLYDMPGSGMKDLQAVTDQKNKTLALTEQESNEIRALQRTQKSLTNEVAKEAAERQKAAEAVAAAAKALADSKAALAATDLSVSGNLAGLLPTSLTSDSGLEIPVKPVLDKTAVVELTNELEGLAVGVSSAIGGLIGDLATGGDAWGNFRNAALSAFADMAIAVGKLAVSTGVAAEGIQAALNFGNPYAAIAAGLALIALGPAVKAGLSNIAAGNYSAGASVASSGYSSQSSASGYNTREVTVNVTGTLKADGDQLIATINNTNRRNQYTQ